MAQDFSKAFYNSSLWQKCRESYMASVHGMCELCNNPGLILHHKILLTPSNINDPEVTLNHENLQFLCLECHNMVHGEIEPIRYTDYKFDAEGNVIPLV